MRRMSQENRLITISWRDIPAQVTARSGRKKASIQLSDRFQRAIDKAATRAGKRTTNEYLGEWRRTETPCGPDLAAAADEAAAELESRFSHTVLLAYVDNDGFRPHDLADEQPYGGDTA
jgi:hypothetical protein